MEKLWPLLQIQLQQGQAVLPVTGGSMHPLLKEGDLVRLREATQPLKRGDAVLYRRRDGKYILHRVIAVTGDQLLCCGDHQRQSEYIQAAQVAAVVSSRGRNGRWKPMDTGMLRIFGWVWSVLYPVRQPLLQLRCGMGRARKQLRRKG